MKLRMVKGRGYSFLFLFMLEEIIHETLSHPFLELFSGQEAIGSFGCFFQPLCADPLMPLGYLLLLRISFRRPTKGANREYSLVQSCIKQPG